MPFYTEVINIVLCQNDTVCILLSFFLFPKILKHLTAQQFRKFHYPVFTIHCFYLQLILYHFLNHGAWRTHDQNQGHWIERENRHLSARPWVYWPERNNSYLDTIQSEERYEAQSAVSCKSLDFQNIVDSAAERFDEYVRRDKAYCGTHTETKGQVQTLFRLIIWSCAEKNILLF